MGSLDEKGVGRGSKMRYLLWTVVISGYYEEGSLYLCKGKEVLR